MSKTTDTDDVYEPNPTLGDLEPVPETVWKTPHRGEIPTIHLRPPDECPGVKETANTTAITDKDPVVLSDDLPVCKRCLEADDCRLLPGVDRVMKRPDKSEYGKSLSATLDEMTVDEFDQQVSESNVNAETATHPDERPTELREADSTKFDPDEPWRFVCPACWPDKRRQVTTRGSGIRSSFRCETCGENSKPDDLIDLKHGKPRRQIDYGKG